MAISTPHSTVSEDRVISSLFNVVIETQRQIYPTRQSTLSEDRVISSLFNVVIDTQRQIYPPGQHSRGQSDLFTVQCCHWHSKADIPHPVNTSRGQSDLFTVQCCHWHSKADIPPQSTLTEDRVISSLLNVVIDTQRQIYHPGKHYQRTEWSLHCSMLSLTLERHILPHLLSSKSV